MHQRVFIQTSFVFLVAGALLSAGCQSAPVTGRKQMLLMPESQEVSMGLSAFNDVTAKEQPSQNAQYNELVQRVDGRTTRELYDEEIRVPYGVDFTMMRKIDVNGPKADPIFQWLTEAAPGLLGSRSIKWNFTKFLVQRDGKTVKRYASTTTPDQMRGDIEAALAVPAA